MPSISVIRVLNMRYSLIVVVCSTCGEYGADNGQNARAESIGPMGLIGLIGLMLRGYCDIIGADVIFSDDA